MKTLVLKCVICSLNRRKFRDSKAYSRREGSIQRKVIQNRESRRKEIITSRWKGEEINKESIDPKASSFRKLVKPTNLVKLIERKIGK